MKILKTVFAALLLVTVGMGATCWAQDPVSNTFDDMHGQSGTRQQYARARVPHALTAPQVKAVERVQQATEKLYSAKSEEEKQTAKSTLKKTLVHQFDLDTEKRSKELDEIKKRLTVMEALLEKRVAGKEDIVALKLQVMVNNANGMGWSQGQQSWGTSTYQSPGYQNPSSRQAQPMSR